MYSTVALARSEPPNLDRMAERGPNSKYYSYSIQIQRTRPGTMLAPPSPMLLK
jgi:hypothetical protein